MRFAYPGQGLSLATAVALFVEGNKKYGFFFFLNHCSLAGEGKNRKFSERLDLILHFNSSIS